MPHCAIDQRGHKIDFAIVNVGSRFLIYLWIAGIAARQIEKEDRNTSEKRPPPKMAVVSPLQKGILGLEPPLLGVFYYKSVFLGCMLFVIGWYTVYPLDDHCPLSHQQAHTIDPATT